MRLFPTFVLTAAKRYFASVRYSPDSKLWNPDDVGGRLIPWPLRALVYVMAMLMRWIPFLQKAVHAVFPHSHDSMMAARTSFFDDAVRKAVHNGVNQVLILAAGLDTRSYRLRSELVGVKVFELDREHVQKYKISALKREHLYSKWGATFVSADFSEPLWIRNLKDAGCNLDNATCVIWEGCTYYLTGTEVECTLRLLRGGNVSVSFDFIHDSVLSEDAGGDLVAQKLKSALCYLNEPIRFGIRKQGINEWASRQGWNVLDVCEGASATLDRFFQGASEDVKAYDFWGMATLQCGY